jgi:hypothetical protein
VLQDISEEITKMAADYDKATHKQEQRSRLKSLTDRSMPLASFFHKYYRLPLFVLILDGVSFGEHALMQDAND